MSCEQFFELTILPGTNRCGEKEGFDRITLRPGDTLSIVGSTGSGKSAFINDIEVLAQGDTVTGRSILINGKAPSDDMVRDPAKKPIALITQNTRVIADLTVSRFLALHIQARDSDTGDLIRHTVALANEFTEAVGELYTSSLIELGLILFLITLVVLALAKILILRVRKKEGLA